MNTRIIPLVERAVVDHLQSKISFTALDISNALKSDRYPVVHGEVAEIVRDIYGAGAMGFYGYERRLIEVTIGGTSKARTFLYLHTEARERDYAARQQSSLPRVTQDVARDLTDSAPLALPLRPTRHSRLSSGPRRPGKHRSDGALAIPKTLVSQLGWSVGISLGLTVEPSRVCLTPDGDIPVQVWGDHRVRICKRKLRLCGLSDIATLSFTMEGSTISIVTNERSAA